MLEVGCAPLSNPHRVQIRGREKQIPKMNPAQLLNPRAFKKGKRFFFYFFNSLSALLALGSAPPLLFFFRSCCFGLCFQQSHDALNTLPRVTSSLSHLCKQGHHMVLPFLPFWFLFVIWAVVGLPYQPRRPAYPLYFSILSSSTPTLSPFSSTTSPSPFVIYHGYRRSWLREIRP